MGCDLPHAQIGVLAAKTRGLQRTGDHDHQLVDVEGFLDEIVGPLLHRRDCDLDIAVARDNHDRDRGVVAFDELQDVDAVKLRVLQPDVENDQIRRFRIDLGQRRVTVTRQPDGMALILQDIADQFTNVALVVDYENIAHVASFLMLTLVLPQFLVVRCRPRPAAKSGPPPRRAGPRRKRVRPSVRAGPRVRR